MPSAWFRDTSNLHIREGIWTTKFVRPLATSTVDSVAPAFKSGSGSRQMEREALTGSYAAELEKREILRELKAHTSSESVHSVVDLGCGDGRGIAILAAAFGPKTEILAVDTNFEDLQRARLNTSEVAHNVTFLQARIEDICEFVSPADVVLALESLYLLRSPELGYQSLAGLLAGEGSVAITTHPRRENHFVHALMNRDIERAVTCLTEAVGSDYLAGDQSMEFHFHWLDRDIRRKFEVRSGLQVLKTDTLSGHGNLLKRLASELDLADGLRDKPLFSNTTISIPRNDVDVLRLEQK